MSSGALMTPGGGLGYVFTSSSSPSRQSGLLSSTPRNSSFAASRGQTPTTPHTLTTKAAVEPIAATQADIAVSGSTQPVATAEAGTSHASTEEPSTASTARPQTTATAITTMASAPEVPAHRFASPADPTGQGSPAAASTSSTNITVGAHETPPCPPTRAPTRSASTPTVGVVTASADHSRTISGTVLTPPVSRGPSTASMSVSLGTPAPTRGSATTAGSVASSSDQKTATPAVLSATGSGQVMLANPLSLQATVLRQPTFAHQTSIPELTEPGDILHDVLGDYVAAHDEAGLARLMNPTSRTSQGRTVRPTTATDTYNNSGDDDDIFLDEQIEKPTARRHTTPAVPATASTAPSSPSDWETCLHERRRRVVRDVQGIGYAHFGVQPVMTMPDTIGTYYTREVFRAFLSLFNSATYPLTGLLIKVDSVYQPDHRTVSLIRQEVRMLPAKSTYACHTGMALEKAGPYTLSVVVTYTDPSNESRRLVWASTVHVEQAISEHAHRTLRCLPLPARTAAVAMDVAPAEAKHGSDDLSDALARRRHPRRHSQSGSNMVIGGATIAQHTLEEALEDLSLPLCKYALTVGLRNTARSSVAITNIRLVLDTESGAQSDRGRGAVSSRTHTDNSTQPFTLLPSRYENYCVVHTNADAELNIAPTASTTTTVGGAGQHDRASDVQCSTTGSFTQRVETGGASALFASQYAGGGHDALRDLHMAPGDTRLYTFEFLAHPERLRRGREANGTGGMPTAEGDRHIALGHVAWRWVSANGDGADGRSSTIVLEAFDAPADFALVVTAVDPSSPRNSEEGHGSRASGEAVEGALASPAPPHRPALQAGEPVTVQCALLYYGTDKDGLDVAVKVRPEKLAPSWLYMGPAVRRLGVVKPRTTTRFTVTLLPCHAGWLTLSGGIEIVRARAPDQVLWPLAPRQGTDASANGASLKDTLAAPVLSSVQSASSTSVPGSPEGLRATNASSGTRTAQQDYHATFLTIAETVVRVEHQPFPPILYEGLVM